LVALFGFALFVYTSNVTGGMLENRYANKNAAGATKSDFTTGRGTLFISEMSAFMEHPFFGIGVGGGKFYRMEELEIQAASHNEMSRLIAEHGLIGIVALFLLIMVPIRHMFKQPYLARAFLASFLIFWFLTINHSAMRIAFPGFIYGLSVAIIVFNEKEEEEEEEETTETSEEANPIEEFKKASMELKTPSSYLRKRSNKKME